MLTVAIRQRKHIRLDRSQIKYLALIVAAVLLFICLYVGALYAATPARGAEAQPVHAQANGHTESVGCPQVRASKWNAQVDRRRDLDGTAGHLRKTKYPVCLRKYKTVKAHNLRRIKVCRSSAKWTGASTFGTTASDDNGIGYRGDNLFSYTDSFAELKMGTALGGLPLHAVRYAHHGRYSARSVKRDIGGGGGAVGGYERGFDAHAPLARKLHINGLAVVQLTKKPCRKVRF